MDREITITVSEEVAAQIDARVSAGEFPSAEKAITEIVNASFGPEPEFDIPDHVLRELVAQADDDEVTYTSEEVHKHLLEHHQKYLASLAAKNK